MSVLVNLEIPVKEERLEDFFDFLQNALIETRAYEGCLGLNTYHEIGSSTVLLIEEWEKNRKPRILYGLEDRNRNG